MRDVCLLRMGRGRKKKAPIDERKLEGFKYLPLVNDLIEGLRSSSEGYTNRKLHFDHFATLLLFYFFNPTLTSLRGLQAATGFAKVRKKLGIPRSSLGSLSAAQHVFDPELLAELIPGLVGKVQLVKGPTRLSEIDKILTAVDGSLLRALPRVAWALWVSDNKRAAKAHVQFEILKGTAYRADLTTGNTSEKKVLEDTLEPGRFYVLDRGYGKFSLFQAIIDAKSNFACRISHAWKFEVLEERALTEADREARVIRDVVVDFGASRAGSVLQKPVRIVEIQRVDEPSKRMRREGRQHGTPSKQTILIVTDRLDLSAEMIALIYSARWEIEIFFRWLKCTLGCKHLLAESRDGMALQLYSALIVCLLISLWTGKKPNKRTFEAICLYFQGWADLEDVLGGIQGLKDHDT